MSLWEQHPVRDDPLPLWEQHPVRDLLVNPNPIARRARLLRGLSPCLCGSSTPCAMDPLSLWEQHPVRDLLVNPNPHRAQGAAHTGRLLRG